MKFLYYSFLIPLLILNIFAWFGHVFGQNAEIKEGVYIADFKEQVFAKVRVTIKNNEIADIEVLEHSGSEIGKNAEKSLINSMISGQTTDVNAITGATYSSNAIKKAVTKAIEKARE